MDTNRTRRELLGLGAALGGTVLAGCTGDGGSDPATRTQTETPTATATETETTTETDAGPYSVSLAPVGEVTFEAVPEDVFTVFPWNADMALALGHGDSINSLWWGAEFGSIMNYFASALDGVTAEWGSLSGSYGAEKERLYELDSDVHLVDPAWLSTLDGWDRADVDEVAERVGPWFGNQYSTLHRSPPGDWADEYRYYTLWELFERVAGVYRERERYEALAAVHDDLLATIEAGLPPESERPTVGYVQMATDLSFAYVLRLNAPGYYNAHTRPLGATDAFADTSYEGAEFKQVDFEALLEADPDVLLTLWGMTSTVDFAALRENLAADSLGSELSAVQNDRVYTQGTRFQGPLMNLFQLEMTAKQLYPEQFGEWPGYVDGEEYPDFDEDEQLFDRNRVADIVTGSP